MKTNLQDIIELSEKTSFSRRKCEKALMDNNNNMDDALQYLLKLKQNPMEVIIDNISAYITGEKGKKFTIYDNGKILISFPVIFAVLFLVFFDISSWIIAALILLIIAFDINLKIESSSKKSKENFKTIVVSEYKNSQSSKKQADIDKKNNESDYNEITIE